MNKITWANKAKKDLRKIPKNQKVQLYQSISTLSKPVDKWHNVKKLKNNPSDYRVIFDFQKKVNIISIEKK
ncbi:MAG: hypothetical protein Rsou_0734 [Candidatus Ruthia sp. Asou_11_S2]|nr:hypothetical protein [Candidatus Ruthia sp. Asou_11_S2]